MTALLLAALAQGAEHRVEAEPDAVVVYADRARVTRSAKVSVGAGRQEVVFEGLPPSVMPRTATADAKGAELIGVDLKRVTASEMANARIAEIDAELVKLGDARVDLDDRVSVANLRLQSVMQSRNQSASALSQQLLVGSRAPQRAESLREELAEEETKARAELRTAERERRDLDREIAALNRERSTLGQGGTDTWTAVVHLDVAKAGAVDLDLSYVVSGASWRPRYDLRGDPEKGVVDLALSAMIAQTTGEDWSDVRLTVSSARPGLGTTVPELSQVTLQRPYRYESAPRAKSSRASGGAAPAMAEAAMDDMPMPAPPPEPEPMAVAVAEVEVAMAATEFTVSRDEDVPSDGTERKVLLTSQSLEARLRHVAVPRLDSRAYLVGEVVNTTDFPLLAGEAGVTLEGAYVGDFMLDTVAPGDEFDVAFGIDDRITVERVPVAIVKEDKAAVGKRVTSSWEWQVEVRNGRRRAIDVEVWEQVPLSSREDVKVERSKASVEAVEEKGGKLRFDMKVAPGSAGKLTWGYRVSYPSDVWMGWME